MISQSNKSGLRNPWVLGFLMFIALVLAVNITFVWFTMKEGRSELVERDYKTKDRKSNELLLSELRTRQALSWQTEIKKPKAIVVGSATAYEISVTDRDGKPVSGALEVEAYRASDSSKDFTTAFKEVAAGAIRVISISRSRGIGSDIREIVAPRGEKELRMAESMIDEARAATATEALEVGLVDFVVDNVDDLLEALNGFTVQVNNEPVTLNTAHAATEPLNTTFIEQFLMMLTNPNIVFTLLSIGTTALLIEISSPGGWVAGFFGVVCIALATYGLGILPVNWFGIIFLVTAFVLFILDIKAPTHGALTAAGVASFIIGALVLFNSAGVPQFQRVSVPLIVGFGILLGLVFFGILMLTSADIALTPTCRFVALSLSGGNHCHYQIGVGAQTASTSTHYLHSGERIILAVAPNSRIAGIQGGGGATNLHITELTE